MFACRISKPCAGILYIVPTFMGMLVSHFNIKFLSGGSINVQPCMCVHQECMNACMYVCILIFSLSLCLSLSLSPLLPLCPPSPPPPPPTHTPVVLVVSSSCSDPLESFSKLFTKQKQSEQGKHPKWITPHVYYYHVLLHDPANCPEAK